MTPEHWHLISNHLPIIGMPIGAAVVAWGLIRRQREIRNVGLVIIALSALATPWIMSTGEDAQMNYEGADFVDSDGYAWMTDHAERARYAAWSAYTAGVLSLAALATGFRLRTTALIFSVMTFAAAIATAGFAIHTADAGGKIRRPDFRENASADNAADTL